MRIEEIRNLCKGEACYLVSVSKKESDIDRKIVAVQKLEVISKGGKYITLEVDGVVYGKRAQKVKFDLTANELLCSSKNYNYTLCTIKEIYELDLEGWALDYDTKKDLEYYKKIENNLISVLPLCKKVFKGLINFDDLKIKVKQLDSVFTLGRTKSKTYYYKDGSKYIEIIGVEINLIPKNTDITKLKEVMFHELGHVLHCQQFQYKDVFTRNLPIDDNVWSYAKTNYLENFAVAVQDAFTNNPKTEKRNEFIYNLIDTLKNK